MKNLVIVGILAVVLCAPVLIYADKSIYSIWVDNFDGSYGCPIENDLEASDFVDGIVDELLLRDSQFFEEGSTFGALVHGGQLLESWRNFNPNINWFNGVNKGDSSSWGGNLLIIGAHGNVQRNSVTDQYFFRFLHTRPVTVDQYCPILTGNNECRSWWRNPEDAGNSRTLVRMGSSSSSTSIGDGRIRWVVFYSCYSLQLEYLGQSSFTIQDIWGHSELNGGYRMLIGGSGRMKVEASEASDEFIVNQYVNDMTIKQAWFDAMDGYYDYGTGEWERGKCVVYAKGGSLTDSRDTRDNDSFDRYYSTVPAKSNQPDGWHSSWSSMECF